MAIPIRNPKRITGLDSRIFASLLRAQRPLPVKQIANRVNVTWPTANLHVQKLAKLNVLTNSGKTIRKNRVSISPQFMDSIRMNKLLKKESDDMRRWLYD